MFKKKCSRCNSKINRNYEYCPFCGNSFGAKEDYGLLGKNDFEEIEAGFFNEPVIDKLFKSAMKMIEKQMKDISQEPKPQKQSMPFSNVDVQFYINGKKVNLTPQKQMQIIEKPKILKKITKEQAEKFAKLPRKEPKTKMTRLSGKLVYELEVPGVKDISDVLINQLESSIEIKALSKDKIYSKTLNVNLPVLNCKLNKPTLILELQVK